MKAFGPATMFNKGHNKTQKYPAGIWCENDVVLTSMRRDYVASTFIRRHFDTKCPMGIVASMVGGSFVLNVNECSLKEKKLCHFYISQGGSNERKNFTYLKAILSFRKHIFERIYYPEKQTGSQQSCFPL